MGQMEQTDWGLPEAAVSWLGLKVLAVQDVLSLPIPDTYHCFLLFYVAVFSRSGGVEEGISSACHFKVQNMEMEAEMELVRSILVGVQVGATAPPAAQQMVHITRAQSYFANAKGAAT
ncbi:GD14066 [Drosophila simulans]|uniref:GD14066 n=1 Tax=Drosophila simulans TaxID=7240 RepID=B4QLK5_DROSI|nr:GD14066 [Drosophila simulans]